MKNFAKKNILSAQKSANRAKRNAALMSALLTIATMVCSPIMAFADNAENAAPNGVGGTNTLNSTVNIVFWVVRVMIIAIAIPSVIKIVQGQQDENPRDRNAGIASVIVAGACFAASFAIRALI